MYTAEAMHQVWEALREKSHGEPIRNTRFILHEGGGVTVEQVCPCSSLVREMVMVCSSGAGAGVGSGSGRILIVVVGVFLHLVDGGQHVDVDTDRKEA